VAETLVEYFAELGEELAKYLEPDKISSIEEAYHFAKWAHRKQKRLTGEPYITHPVAAAKILAEIRMDYQSIMATLLHDVIEDTEASKQDLVDKFGDDVAELVDGVSKLTKIKFESRAEMQAENFRKMVLAMVRDIRVIIVKLADRLHNMRTISAMSPKKQRIKARETLEIYAPIANRLGMHRFYIELEDLCFRAYYPMRYRILNDALNTARGNRKEIVSLIEKEITDSFAEKDIKIIQMYGRQKHLYSIYRKMRTKKASFAEIMDMYGFRIVVASNDDCYRVLGVVHSLYKPLPVRFKDYIAIPKANGYQSLHTTLFGPYGVPIEIQIRTEEMENIANNGVASHWIYKQSKDDENNDAQLRAQQWVRSLLEMQKSAGSSIEFIETVKIDLFPDEVYVFTPRGDILELPRGATPVDFAYAIHSDVGNSCVAAKINRRMVPLSSLLVNGQKIEIITAPGACPNPAWLNFVVTGKARSNIRHFLKSQQHVESIALGKRLLAKALHDLGSSLDNINEEILDKLVKELKYQSFEELAEAIGLGNQVAQVVSRRLIESEFLTDETNVKADINQNPLVIKGTEGMVLNFSECCRPIPGDPIIGYIKAGRGIQVHVESCHNISKLRRNPERLINLRWEEKVKGEFLIDLTIEVRNERGVLADVARNIADTGGNIDNISVEPSDGQYNLVQLTITVRDRVHLALVMRRLRKVTTIVRIFRKK
jgi:GTP diphosphokinase / guanosine-3',5'-bis(diphosphate) 3'-diphosphatase